MARPQADMEESGPQTTPQDTTSTPMDAGDMADCGSTTASQVVDDDCSVIPDLAPTASCEPHEQGTEGLTSPQPEEVTNHPSGVPTTSATDQAPMVLSSTPDATGPDFAALMLGDALSRLNSILLSDSATDAQSQDPPPPYTARDDAQSPSTRYATTTGAPTDLSVDPAQHYQQVPDCTARQKLGKKVIQRLMAVNHIFGKLRGVSSWTYWHTGFCCGLLDGDSHRLTFQQIEYIKGYVSCANNGQDLAAEVKELLDTYKTMPPAPPITPTSVVGFGKCVEILRETATMLGSLDEMKAEGLREHTKTAKSSYFVTLLGQFHTQLDGELREIENDLGIVRDSCGGAEL